MLLTQTNFLFKYHQPWLGSLAFLSNPWNPTKWLLTFGNHHPVIFIQFFLYKKQLRKSFSMTPPAKVAFNRDQKCHVTPLNLFCIQSNELHWYSSSMQKQNVIVHTLAPNQCCWIHVCSNHSSVQHNPSRLSLKRWHASLDLSPSWQWRRLCVPICASGWGDF